MATLVAEKKNGHGEPFPAAYVQLGNEKFRHQVAKPGRTQCGRYYCGQEATNADNSPLPVCEACLQASS